MVAYSPSEWHDLFVATAGASAALAGLVFVAVSINIERILKFEGLPERALETVLLLVGVLLISIVGLIPAAEDGVTLGQGQTALGLELLGVGLLLGVGIVWLGADAKHSEEEPRTASWARWTMRLAGTVPLVVGALSVLAGSGGGLYWVVAGIAFAIVAAVANAWVLLVEILR